mmetsp:Transcript_112823/g.324225  ORF Transcript_112823/g.324225 Transcript_112823/m.324225 type:complete len:245 (-) Transcript_112823:589-1323(-)
MLPSVRAAPKRFICPAPAAEPSTAFPLTRLALRLGEELLELGRLRRAELADGRQGVERLGGVVARGLPWVQHPLHHIKDLLQPSVLRIGRRLQGILEVTILANVELGPLLAEAVELVPRFGLVVHSRHVPRKQQAVEDQASGPSVALRAPGLIPGRLADHLRCRIHQRLGLARHERQALRVVAAGTASVHEVRNLQLHRISRAKHDEAFGLHIAVDEPLVVHRLQALQELHDEADPRREAHFLE